MVFLAVVLALAIAATVAYVGYRKDQARIATLQSLCLSNGWQFSAADPFGLPDRWDGAPFDAGRARRARNVITGEVDGHPLVAFDYQYKEDSGSGSHRNTTTKRFAVCALRMPCVLPELQVSPENVLTRVGNALGLDDIALESEEFNRRYRVRCPDPKLASDVLSPRTMELLMGAGPICFRFAGGDVLSYDSGRLEPAELLHRVAVLSRVVAGVPAFVWKDHGVAERGAP